MSPKISIVTLTWKGLNVIKPCIESVLSKCANVNFEWIIRVNLPNDGTIEYLTELEANKPLKVIIHDNDGNFSKMNNECISECEGEYLLFLNNDTEAINDFITPMLNILENDSNVGIVGSVLKYPNDSIQHCGISFSTNKLPSNVTSGLCEALGHDINGIIKRDRVYQCVTGASLMIRKSDFLALGQFNESYNWCFDDVDLGLSMTYNLGKMCVVSKDSLLYHKESYSKAKPNIYDSITMLLSKFDNKIIQDNYKYGALGYNVYSKI